jgi:hypothetical protein
MIDFDDPKYIEYLNRLDEEDQRAADRRGKTPPHPWGFKFNNYFYFCHPCWYRGELDGSHPYDQPPCDPISRRDIG